MDIEQNLTNQINKLALIQYLIWQKKVPEGFHWEAIEISFCYQLLQIPFSQKLSQFSLSTMRAKLAHLAKKYDLPKDLAGLKALEKSFRLEIDGERYPVSNCSAINQLLAESKSNLRLCSGFYGSRKFYILGEAIKQQIGDYLVYRLKKEVAVTPGCHLLMAAMVGGKNIFLRETSARFLFHHKWEKTGDPNTLGDKIKQFTLEQFGQSQGLISAFMDNLFYHELNHSSIVSYVKDLEILGIAQASMVLGQNILNHLLEVFADWLPGQDTRSPLLKIFNDKDLGQLTLYISDNWFYDSSFPEQHIFSLLDLAPVFAHCKAGRFDWQALIKEATDTSNGSLLNLYLRTFEEIAQRLKQIVEESEFMLTDRQINYKTISAYAENEIKSQNKTLSKSEHAVTYWSNIFNYLKKFSRKGYGKALNYLKQAEKNLERKVGSSQTIQAKAQEFFRVHNNA